MKCFSCGCETSDYLCSQCLTEPVLDRVFYEIMYYKPEECTNPYVAEYASALTEKYEERKCIPDIMKLFDYDVAEYYYCLYYKYTKDERFEETAKSYLAKHPWGEIRSQKVIRSLFDHYRRNDYFSPAPWSEWIGKTDGLCCELYKNAAEYYGMVGEYDAADAILDKALGYCEDPEFTQSLGTEREKMIEQLKKQQADILRYRTKKPYWPQTEERQRVIAKIYDEKGIQYVFEKTKRRKTQNGKVPESEFAPLNECYADELADYCAFWCEDAFSVAAAKSIYQIAAVKVRNGQVKEEFQSLIRPWDGAICRKDAAKKAGVDLSVIESAEDVDQVMKKFFEFVGGDILVSTGALGNQAKLISRAARYTGMKAIPNEFYDLLDLAAETSPKFDLENNTREYLLSYFGVKEGKDALEKAVNNKKLYDELRNYEE